MFSPIHAVIDWNQAFLYGLIGGGAVLVVTTVGHFIRGMFLSREEIQSLEKNQSMYLGFLALGIVMVLGGIYFRSSPNMNVAGSSDDFNSFRVFESKDGQFRASFPGTPKVQTQNALGLSIKMFSVEEKDGIFGVAYIDFKKIASPTSSQVDSMLTNARKGMLSNMKATLISEDKITLQGKFPGREVRAEITGGRIQGAEMYCSIYYVNGRAYQVLVMGRPNWLNSEKARKFLNSFEVR